MSDHLDVRVHRSQFPGEVASELVRCLRARRLNHKFLYESNRQAGLWLAIHEKFAPYRIDRNGRSVYAKMFSRCAEQLNGRPVEVISLGCGSGHKDADLLGMLRDSCSRVSYAACDVSPALVVESSLTVAASNPDVPTSRHVFDLMDPSGFLDSGATDSGQARLVLAFGLAPNFEPAVLFPRMRELLGGGGRLLLSANLSANGTLASILPQYDNDETREWLLTFVRDLGIDAEHDWIRFTVEGDRQFDGVRRIEANLTFAKSCLISVGGEKLAFEPEDRMRLFFSYRYTLEQLREVVEAHRLRIADAEVAVGGEEGVFELALR